MRRFSLISAVLWLSFVAQLALAADPIFVLQGNSASEVTREELKTMKVRLWKAYYFKIGQSTANLASAWGGETDTTEAGVMAQVRRSQRWETAYEARFGIGSYGKDRGSTYYNFVGPVAVVSKDPPKPMVKKGAGKAAKAAEAANAKSKGLLDAAKKALLKEGDRLTHVLEALKTIGETAEPVKGILDKPTGIESTNPYQGIGTATREYAENVVEALKASNRLSDVLGTGNAAQLAKIKALLKQLEADRGKLLATLENTKTTPKAVVQERVPDETPDRIPRSLAEAKEHVRQLTVSEASQKNVTDIANYLPQGYSLIEKIEKAEDGLVLTVGEAKYNVNRENSEGVFFVDFNYGPTIVLTRNASGVPKPLVSSSNVSGPCEYWSDNEAGLRQWRAVIDTLNRHGRHIGRDDDAKFEELTLSGRTVSQVLVLENGSRVRQTWTIAGKPSIRLIRNDEDRRWMCAMAGVAPSGTIQYGDSSPKQTSAGYKWDVNFSSRIYIPNESFQSFLTDLYESACPKMPTSFDFDPGRAAAQAEAIARAIAELKKLAPEVAPPSPAPAGANHRGRLSPVSGPSVS